MIVEWAGNGGYHNQFGDTCDGLPEGCKLGYGLAAGRGAIWLCLPYLNTSGDGLALKWWGDPPGYDPEPTLAYCRAAVKAVCEDYRGDPERVILCGFSRGAIACNYLGLHDDETARLWSAFFAFSHYDGVRWWPYPGSDAQAAAKRLGRLHGRPQLVCAEGDGIHATREYLASQRTAFNLPLDNITFLATGFRNHNDAWILRPSPARAAARAWLRTVAQTEPHVPAEVLDLSAWKLTLPFDTQRPGRPDEVTHPELQSFADRRCFYLSSAGDAVLFRAHCGGTTTKGSRYPRSELRQMEASGIQETQWSTADNKWNAMYVEQAILQLPQKKPHVVCAQIHDADDDLLKIRLEKRKLFVERDGQPDVMLEPNYELGQRFRLRIAAGEGRVQVWYNDQLKLDWSVLRAGCYFKVGCYTQSNTDQGDAEDAFGEVALYELSLDNVKPN